MTTTMQLGELMTNVRSRADMLPASYDPTLTGNLNLFVSDPELISYINQSYFELYDLLVSRYGADYFSKLPPYLFLTDGINDKFPLPVDFYKLLAVDLGLSNGNDSFVTIHPFNFADRNRYAVPNFQSFYGVTNLRYRLNADSIWLTPTPSGGQRIRIWYVPRLTTLAALTDVADGISGWTEYIIDDAAIKCLAKEESDTTQLERAKAALISRIQNMAQARDAANPKTVADNAFNEMWWPSGNGNPGSF